MNPTTTPSVESAAKAVRAAKESLRRAKAGKGTRTVEEAEAIVLSRTEELAQARLLVEAAEAAPAIEEAATAIAAERTARRRAKAAERTDGPRADDAETPPRFALFDRLGRVLATGESLSDVSSEMSRVSKKEEKNPTGLRPLYLVAVGGFEGDGEDVVVAATDAQDRRESGVEGPSASDLLAGTAEPVEAQDAVAGLMNAAAGGPSLDEVVAASARAAAERASKPAKEKPAPRTKNPAGEVGTPEWKALRDRLVAEAAKDEKRAIRTALAAKDAGVPWKALSAATRGGLPGFYDRVWAAYVARRDAAKA